MATSAAMRDTALLMPEASPARAGSSASITVVVNGATNNAPPKPSRTAAGKNVVQYEPPPLARAKARKPMPARMLPVTSGKRAPIRATRPPDQRESVNMMTMNGSSEAPAAVGE